MTTDFLISPARLQAVFLIARPLRVSLKHVLENIFDSIPHVRRDYLRASRHSLRGILQAFPDEGRAIGDAVADIRSQDACTVGHIAPEARIGEILGRVLQSTPDEPRGIAQAVNDVTAKDFKARANIAEKVAGGMGCIAGEILNRVCRVADKSANGIEKAHDRLLLRTLPPEIGYGFRELSIKWAGVLQQQLLIYMGAGHFNA